VGEIISISIFYVPKRERDRERERERERERKQGGSGVHRIYRSC